ncbi:MAG TPA: PLxRFG domain-containing protein, partial [Synergistales bacterium]|nr:PLxRFG domain-containing protein [Synergistales bacterium]
VILNKDIAREINQSRPSEMQLDGVIETGRGTISDEGINAIQAVRDRWVNEGKGPTPEEIHQYPFLEDVFKGQKPGKSDYVPPQELAGAARAIDQARISQRTSPGTARLAQHLLTLDPTFDQNSTLEISDAVHKATPDIIKREGLDPEGEYAILGKTVSHIEDAATRTAISLYKGHDADTLVEEWYHRAYDRLNPKDRAAYDAYHKKTGDTRSPNEHFAQEGRDFFFSDKLHEAAGGIRGIFEGAREALKALIKRVRDLRGAKIPKKIQEMYRRAGQARKEARAPRKKPSKAYEEIAEGMPYYQARKINKDQADLDAGARDARRVADQQLGKKPQDIDKGFFEGITDLKPIRDLLHELGIKDKYDGITLTNKDYVDVYKYLQMPADVKISHPEFGPLYDRQRERELSKAILDHAFAKKTEPYFKGMDDADRIKVDAALIQGEQEGVSFYDPLQLKERFGLNEKQIAGYTAIRDSLDAAGEMLLWEMEQSGVKPEALEEFKTRLAGYVPHKWYGNWAIIVRKKGGKKTKFMTKTNFLDRYTERDRVQALYPNDEVFVMQSKKIPYEAYQDAAPWAVSKMVDLVIDKAEVSPAMADELKQALGDLYKSKGFGAHFIKRKGTPGWTEDLAKPLAEYFAGLNGYMTKMRAIKGFAEDIQAIDPKKKPNLYRYALDYIRYVTGEPFEFAGAKQAAYIYYLYANIKSAAVNLTQNMLLGWPVLAKHTRLAGAKLLQAQARAANRHMLTDGEKAFLEEMESLGYLDPKMAVEMGAFTANPLLRQIPQGVKDFGEFIDIFQHMEAWNRRAMAVALYDSGIREPMRAAELIEEAHFRYSKGNRPELMRGIISPIMTFRSWMINYVTWLKNEIKAGRLAPVARSLAAMVLLGGFAGLPFFKLLKKLWVKVFGEDPQTAAAKHIGKSWATLIFRGLPSKLGISFTGSIGLGDILPTDLKSLGGVFADIPGRIARVIKDLSSRDYVRALEDASPEAIRQPMAAYRSATEGDTTRSGAPIFDPTTGEQQRLTAGEAATKSLGFQPMRSAERWDLQETVQQIQDARTARKQEWANRYVVAMRAGNKKEVARVVREINDYNKRMKAAGRPDDMITKAEVLSAIQSRKKAGVPPKYMRPKWKRLLEGRGMMPSQ